MKSHIAVNQILSSGDTNASRAQSGKSYAAVPEPFKGFFEPLLADGRPSPYAVLTPAFEGYLSS
jgi:hypothetical protein